MNQVTTAAELCVRMKALHTGDSKLANIRELLAKDRAATAEEGYAALEADLAVPQTTLNKARALIDYGAWHSPENTTAVSIEDTIVASSKPKTVPRDHGVSRIQADEILLKARDEAAKIIADAHATASTMTVPPVVPPVTADAADTGPKPGVTKTEIQNGPVSPGVQKQAKRS